MNEQANHDDSRPNLMLPGFFWFIPRLFLHELSISLSERDIVKMVVENWI